MYHALDLSHLGPFRDLHVEFPDPHGGAQFLAFTGRGKTTVLRGAALALCDGNTLAAYPARVGYPLLRDGAWMGTARVLSDDNTYFNEIRRRDEGEGDVVHCPSQMLRPFVVAYGSARGIARAETSNVGNGMGGFTALPQFYRIGSLFDDSSVIVSVRGALSEMHRYAINARDGAEWAARLGGMYHGTCAALATILGAEKVEMGAAHVMVDGKPLPSLGSGVNSLATWVVDMMSRWADRELRGGLTIGEGFPAEIYGVCIVDSIDQHLHPRMQVELVGRLRATFPKVTFIVSVDGPMALTGLRSGEVVVLSENGVALYHRDDPRLLTCTEIVRRYFEIDDIHPNESGRMLREYQYLAANPYRSDSDHAAMLQMQAMLVRDKILAHDHTPVPRHTIGK